MLQLYMMGMTSPRRTIAAPPLYSLRGSVTIYFQPPGTMSISYTLPPFTSLLVPLSPVLSHSTSAPSLFAMSTVYEFVGCVHCRIPCIIPTLFCFILNVACLMSTKIYNCTTPPPPTWSMHPSNFSHDTGISNSSIRGTAEIVTLQKIYVPTEIQSPKSTKLQSIYVAFYVSARVRWPPPTKIFRSVQSKFT